MLSTEIAIFLPNFFIFHPIFGNALTDSTTSLLPCPAHPTRPYKQLFLATTRYKDCCSLISPEPVTKAYMPMLERIEDKVGMDAVIEEILAKIEANMVIYGDI